MLANNWYNNKINPPGWPVSAPASWHDADPSYVSSVWAEQESDRKDHRARQQFGLPCGEHFCMGGFLFHRSFDHAVLASLVDLFHPEQDRSSLPEFQEAQVSLLVVKWLRETVQTICKFGEYVVICGARRRSPREDYAIWIVHRVAIAQRFRNRIS